MLTQEEISKLDTKEITRELESARKEHFRLKIGVRTKHLKDSHKAKLYQKYIARLKTQQSKLKKEEQKKETLAK